MIEEVLKSKNCVIPELGVARCETFSAVYPYINQYLMEYREWQPSRDGNVKEILDFKTQITNPYRRLVGGYNRNINPFFLLAEAMWIFVGRKDVKFLTMFNKNMENFSDDGNVFHAPYGFRLRHWGVRSEDKFCEENLHAAQGYDQISDAIKILANNPNSRQVVLTIWNPDLDLGTKTKDIPCNDIIMLKIRDGKLITTVQNRSNDLHWGLPTNVFQFSFLTEMIAACLGIELGTQTHNSQSLHVYEWNKIAETMLEGMSMDNELYNNIGATECPVDFNFSMDVPGNRLREIEYNLNVIIDNLERVYRGAKEVESEINSLKQFSSYLYSVYKMLYAYLIYKMAIKDATPENKNAEIEFAINAINLFCDEVGMPENWDVRILATEWLSKKIKSTDNKVLGL